VQAAPRLEKPVVYITFDDGPSSDGVTDELLEVLERHNAKATFFVTGDRARANPAKIRSIIAAGHAIGNHTTSHSRLPDLFDHQVAAELSSTNLYVLDAGGPAMSCFRAPFGAVNQQVVAIADRLGLSKVGWDIDTRDWDPYTNINEIAVQLEDAQHNSVVLLHDGPNARWRSLRVFTRWIDDVGHLYSFEALPECLKPSSQSNPVVTLAAIQSDRQPASNKGKAIKIAAKSAPVFSTVAIHSEVKSAIQPVKATIKESVVAEQPVVEFKEQTIHGIIDKLRNYEITLN